MTPSTPSKRILRSRPTRILLPILVLLLSGTAAQALTSEFRILMNVDVNPATGCDVTTADGVFPGVEQMLVTTVETGASTGQVTLVERRECDEGTNTFGPTIPVSAGDWPVGVGLGLDGSDVVETFVAVSDIGGDNPPPVIRLGVVGDNGGRVEDALLVVQPAGAQPILLNLATILEIPTLSEWGLILLALLLVTLALWQMRRMGRSGTVALLLLVCLGVTVVAWASVRDGLIDDWLGVSPLAEDPESDAPLGADLRALFAQVSGGEICFRIDAFLEFNGPPNAVDDDFMVTEDSVGNSLDVLGNDDDPEMDPLAITAVGTPDQGGTATTDGLTISYTPAADFKGVETFTYTIDDGNGNMATATVTVTVTNVNDPPDAVDDSFMVAEDSSDNSLDVLANDTDAPDMGETLTITGVGTPDQGGSVSSVGGGTSLSYTPAADFAGIETFTYTIDDGNGGMDTATVTVTVTNENDPPDAVDDMFTVDEDSSDNSLDVLANDTDAPDTGETLTITGVGVTDQGGTATTDGSTVSYTPAANFVGMETFTYTISDGNGGMDTATVTVTVQDANPDPPVCGADSATTDEDTSTLVAVLANDTDPDPGQTATLTVSAVDDTGTIGTVMIMGATDVTYDPNGAFESLGDGDMATDTFSYTAQDSSTPPLTCTATVTVTITGVDDPAMVTNDVYRTVGNTLLEVDDTRDDPLPSIFVTGSVLANDSDPDDPVAVTGTSGVTAGAVVNMAADGTFTYVPPPGLRGDGNPATADDSFQYQLTGGELGTVEIDIDGLVWYVDNTANGGAPNTGTGTSVDRFSTLSDGNPDLTPDDADDASQVGDVVYVFQGDGTNTNYDERYAMNNGQKLLGEGVDLIVDVNGTPTTLFTGNPANKPLLQTTFGVAVPFNNSAAEVAGLDIRGFPGISVLTGAGASVIIRDNAITGLSGSTGLLVDHDTAGTQVLQVLRNTIGGDVGVDVTNTSGTLHVVFDQNTGLESTDGGAAAAASFTAPGGQLLVTSFSGNQVADTTATSGLVFDGVVFDADPATAAPAFEEVPGGVTTVGTSGTPVPGVGVSLAGVKGNLHFTQLDVFNTGDVGLLAAADTSGGTGFELSVAGGALESTGGTHGVSLTDVTIDPAQDFLLGSIQSSGSTRGIELLRVGGGDFSITDGGGTSVLSSTNEAIRVEGGSSAVSFSGVSATRTTVGGAAILGLNHTGPFTMTGGTLTHSNGRLVDFDNMDGGSNLGGMAVATDNHHGKRLVNSSGTHTFPDVVINSATPAPVAGVFLQDNAGATVNFAKVDVHSNAAAAFFASNGGSVNVADATSQLTARGHRALDASGTSFNSVTFAGATVPAANPSGVGGVVLANNTGALTIGKVDVTTTGGTGFSATNAGTVNVTDNTSRIDATNGPGLVINPTAVNLQFALVRSQNSSGAGISIAGATGTGVTLGTVDIDGSATQGIELTNNAAPVTINGGDVSTSTGNAFDVDQGAANVTYNGTINNGAARAVEVTNRTGGTVGFGGAVVDNGATNSGILLDNNDSGTVQFTGTVDVTGASVAGVTFQNSNGGTANFADLDVDNSGTNQIALFATNNTGGGTLNVTTGTAHGGTNSAVDIDNTVLGVTLARTDSTGGGAVGIDLFQTTGSFAVVGDGSNARNGSGGTIQNKTGRGIRINRVTNVTLNSLNVTNTGDDGIFGGDELGVGDTNDFVNGLTMRGSVFSGNGNSANEHGMEFRDLIGTVLFDNVRVTNAGEHGIVHFNDSGVIASLTFQNSEIDNLTSGIGYNFELKSGAGNPALTAGTISANNVHDNFSTGLFFINNGTGNLGAPATPLTIQGNTLTNNNIAIDVSFGAQSNTTHFAILGNPVILGNTSHAINVASADTAGNTSSNVINGTIMGNVIGDGTTGSGSTTGTGIRLNFSDPIDAAIRVDNNQILNVKGRGIEAVGRLGGGGGNAAFTLTNNLIRRDPGTPLAGDTFAGIFMSADGNGVCGNVRNNDVNGDICENFGAPGFVFLGCDILVQEVAGSAFQLESSATDCGGAACADAKAHLLANNSNTTANPLRVEEIDGAGTIVSGNIALVAPGTCDTP